MITTRVIPILLLSNGGLVKGKQFKDHQYIGDPINSVKIFNDKEVDEIAILDITASNNNIDYNLLNEISSEAFMPLSYGGGIDSTEQIAKLFQLGIEKIILNSNAFRNPKLVQDAAKVAGSQSIVVSMDVRKNLFGSYEVYIDNAKTKTGFNPVDYAKKMEGLGAGELIISSVDRDGMFTGYDTDLINCVSKSVNIPTVALGGARDVNDLLDVVNSTQVSAVAASSMFLYHGKHRAVLITYPSHSSMQTLFKRE